MRKPMKIALSVLVTVALYAGLYYVAAWMAAPEEYDYVVGYFAISSVACLAAIPVGFAATKFLDKRNVGKNQAGLVILAIAAIWGYVLGWLSLTGMVIGRYAAGTGKERKKGREKKK